jgi:predicted acetyltransferase
VSPDLHFRPAEAADTPAICALSLIAYPAFSDTAEGRAQRYRQLDALYSLERLVVERAGRHVGQYATFAHEIWLGGRPSPVGGLASIAVAPEARRTGVAAAICRHHLARQRERGVPWSLLYPFSPRFYAAHGWAAAAWRVRWRFRPADLPLFAEREQVASVALSIAGAASLVDHAYRRWCAETNGSIARNRAQLDWQWGGERVIAAGARTAEGRLGGYLFALPRAGASRPQTLVVPEFVATDGAARRALYGFLAAQGDQYDAIELDAPPGDPIGALLDCGAPEHEDDETMPEEHQPVATVYAGAMARIVDLPSALAARGYAASARGRVAFAVSDSIVDENRAVATLTVEEGAASVAAGRAAGAPLVIGPVGAVTQVLVGAIDLTAAVRLGKLAVDPPDAAPAAGALLALPPPYPLVVF